MDEEQNLPVALQSLAGLGAEVFVVDSGSSDGTIEIARSAGCNIASHDFTTHARQLNWALDNLPLKSDWVMRLDADERLTPELAAELREKLTRLSPDVTGLMIKRRVYFWGRWIKHGGYYPIWLLRIWRRGLAVCEDRDMDEHMLIARGRIEHLEHDIIDENHKGLGFWIDKHNRYAAKEVAALKRTPNEADAARTGKLVARKRFLKERLYGRSPRFLRAFFYWTFRYFFQLGFLDGTPGFVFHFLQGLWYRVLVDAKMVEAERRHAHDAILNGRNARSSSPSAVTGDRPPSAKRSP
jgi:glycosyltransferase involved in cell wall biosynthesis